MPTESQTTPLYLCFAYCWTPTWTGSRSNDFQVHEFPTTSRTLDVTSGQSVEDSNLVSSALTARIEALEAENACLKSYITKQKDVHFGINQIKHDKLIIIWFSSYRIFLGFFCSCLLQQSTSYATGVQKRVQEHDSVL